jgi:hypothetical protein
MNDPNNLGPLDHIDFHDGDLALELLNIAPHPVHKVSTYFFRMVHFNSRQEIGRINLRVDSNSHIELYARHVGYSVEPIHSGNGYASRALRLLKPLALKFNLDTLWITCDPENIASRRTCELGTRSSWKSWMFPSTASSTRADTPGNAAIE